MRTSPVRRRSLGAVGLLAAVVLLLPACQQSGLRVMVRKSASWANGYEATITIANEGRGRVEGWTVEFDVPPDVKVETYWDAGGRETPRLDWYMAMACFKLGVVIEGTWSRYLMGKASRDAGEALHANAQNLIDIGTRVVKGDNPFDLN